MAIMNDLKLPMLSYYVIFYKRFRQIMQRTEKETLRGATIERRYVPFGHFCDVFTTQYAPSGHLTTSSFSLIQNVSFMLCALSGSWIWLSFDQSIDVFIEFILIYASFQWWVECPGQPYWDIRMPYEEVWSTLHVHSSTMYWIKI